MSATIGPALTFTVTFAPTEVSTTLARILDTSSLPKLVIVKGIAKAELLKIRRKGIESKRENFFI
jgi:hypothetical protein